MAEFQEPNFRGAARGQYAVRRLFEYSTLRTHEAEKTRRLLLAATVALVILAAVVTVFAPAGRENLGYAIGAVLIVLALGAVGAAQFKFQLPGVDVQATRERLDVVPSAPLRKPLRSPADSAEDQHEEE